VAAISTRFGSGGSQLTPGGASGSPDLATVLRGIADDLAGLQVVQPEGDDIAAVDLADAGAAWDADAQALVNQLKGSVNALVAATNNLRSLLATQAAVAIKTTKEG
jgi:hypothetical protein